MYKNKFLKFINKNNYIKLIVQIIIKLLKILLL